MSQTDAHALAPCGLDCSTCEIRRAANDPALAERLAERFRAAGRPNAVPQWFRCQGCPGDRNPAVHWSADCAILACCVDSHGLASCSECDSFPCERLSAWAARAPRYTVALERLRAAAGAADD